MLSPTISTTKPFPQSGNESLQVRNIFRERVGFDIHLENDIPAKIITHPAKWRKTMILLWLARLCKRHGNPRLL